MKLPADRDMYDHNKYLGKVAIVACNLSQRIPLFEKSPPTAEDICHDNLRQIKELQAMLLHLELAIEEIFNLRELR